MRSSPARALLVILLSVSLIGVAAAVMTAALAADGGARGLNDLLYGEALYASRNQEHLVAISRLLSSASTGSRGRLPASQALVLARLATGYGLYNEAKSILRSIPREQVSAEELNRAWYQLARVDFNRGNADEALEALNAMDRALPGELEADRRLLLGQVLLALGRNEEAAQVLADWRGPPTQTAYANYNRGVALLRAGQAQDGIRALERVDKLPADDEELLALKDKVNLALGYALAQQGDFDRARSYLERVRLQGPYSNAALLATGWLELERGRPEAALAPWLALRGRTASDPAVQESLLTVPSVQRELKQLPSAAREFEAAVDSYSQQLEELGQATESLRSGMGLETLLGDAAAASRGDSAVSSAPPGATSRHYLGEIMAGGDYQSILRDYGDLAAVEKHLKDWMGSVRALDQVMEGRLPPPPGGVPDTKRRRPGREEVRLPPSRRSRDEQRGTVPGDQPLPGPSWQPQPWPPQAATKPPGPKTRTELPDPELPPDPEVTPLPEPEVIWLPDAPEFLGLPESDGSGLPPAPEYLDSELGLAASLPDRPEWRELGEQLAWLPYPRFDFSRPPQVSPAAARGAVQWGRTTGQEEPPPPAPPGLLLGLTGLDEAIEGAVKRSDALRRVLDASEDDHVDLRARLAALRERIAALEPWVARTMALHEDYVRRLALHELERRKERLEGYLERARWDLARTYDQATEN